MKNRISGLLMETGVNYNKRRLHKVGYFDDLMSSQRRDRRQYPAVAEAEPGDDQPIAEAGLRAGQFSGTRPAAEGETEPLKNRSRSGSDHRADLGVGDRGCCTFQFDQTGHQLLRTVRSGEEFSRQGHAHTDLQAAKQTYSAGAGRSGKACTQIQP